MSKQFKDLKEKKSPEARGRAAEKAERLLREISSQNLGGGHAAEGSSGANEQKEPGGRETSCQQDFRVDPVTSAKS